MQASSLYCTCYCPGPHNQNNQIDGSSPLSTLPWASGECGCSGRERSVPSVGFVRAWFGNRSLPLSYGIAGSLPSFRLSGSDAYRRRAPARPLCSAAVSVKEAQGGGINFVQRRIQNLLHKINPSWGKAFTGDISLLLLHFKDCMPRTSMALAVMISTAKASVPALVQYCLIQDSDFIQSKWKPAQAAA